MTGDVGTCELPLHVRLYTTKVTWLQFWGMHDFHPSWGHIFHNKIPCFVAGRVRLVSYLPTEYPPLISCLHANVE